MAKKGTNGRIRFVYAEIEGDDATLQQGLSTFAAGLSKTFQPNIVVKRIARSDDGEDSEEFDPDDLLGEDEELDDVVEGQSRPANGKAKGNRKFPSMSLVKGLDLVPDSKESLADFYGLRKAKASKQYSQVTLVVYYMEKILELEKVTPNHVFTCFDHLKIKKPNDLPQTIRNIAKRNGYLETTDGQVTVTTMGENHVEHDLKPSEDINE